MLRPIQNESELREVLRWRNHPDVRRVMFTDHEILWDEHLAWWDKAASDETKRILLYCEGDRPIGCVQFFDIHDHDLGKSCHWGFYLDNDTLHCDHLKLKTWLSLERQAIDYAFNTLHCSRLICETFEFNESVIEVHKKFGFQETTRYTKTKEGKAEIVIEMMLSCFNQQIFLSEKSSSPKQVTSIETSLSFAFLGSANWDLAAQNFIDSYKKWTQKKAELLQVPFGQYKSFLVDCQSPFYTKKADIWIFCERIEDFIPSSYKVLTPKSFQSIKNAFNDYLEYIKKARDLTEDIFYILDLFPVCPNVTSFESSIYEPSSSDAFVYQLNQELYELCLTLPNCHLICLSKIIQQVGIRQSAPDKYWHIGRFPYRNALIQKLNEHLIATFLASKGKTARIIVTDLDNTLWGGVIGEDGLQGIQLGGDYPGSVFSEIQETLLSLNERGITLSICSKNTESVALEVFHNHPEMRLKLENFAAIKINWRDKAQNIIEIANELGVGLSSILLFDDSPYEREAIRQQLHQVIVPELPEDSTHWSSFLLNYPYLATLELTEEDKKRATSYQIRAQIQREMSSYIDKTMYWRSLEMHLTLYRFQKHHQKRILQLLTKTNQFNTTTQRYTALDLQQITNHGGMIFPIGLADKYSEHEVIGLIILIPSEVEAETLIIDSFLLSCRVLGRGIETAILGWICQKARHLGFECLQGNFVASDRNLPAKEAFISYGFHPLENGNYRLNVSSQSLTTPDWIAVHEEL